LFLNFIELVAMEEDSKEAKPASVVVPSAANEGEGSATSVDENLLQATKPPKKGAAKASGNCVPDAFYWSIDEVASWVEDIGYWQYKVGGRNLEFILS
jgi:hypothetical protein